MLYLGCTCGGIFGYSKEINIEKSGKIDEIF
jgi:hypothetical protein